MAEKYSIAGNSGESPLREQIVTYLNTTTSEQPVWSPMGENGRGQLHRRRLFRGQQNRHFRHGVEQRKEAEEGAGVL